MLKSGCLRPLGETQKEETCVDKRCSLGEVLLPFLKAVGPALQKRGTLGAVCIRRRGAPNGLNLQALQAQMDNFIN